MALAFQEVQFPPQISYGAKGGPSWSTDVIILSGGDEQRNANWANARLKWNVSTGLKHDIDVQELLAFFYAFKGKAVAFRYKDWSDYLAYSAGQTNVGTGGGHGATTQVMNYGVLLNINGADQHLADGSHTTYQMAKLYTVTSPYNSTVYSYLRPLVKPCNFGAWDGSPSTHPDGSPAQAVKPYHNGTPVATTGFSVDYTTGIITFTSAPTHSSVTSGSGYELTVDCEFDVPSRFDTDDMEISMENFDTDIWQDMTVVEVRAGD